jgi:hypothetical protein
VVKHAVSTLGGALLDAAVAKAEADPLISMWGRTPWIDDGTTAGHGMTGRSYSPSTDWSQGGPIIEREQMAVFHLGSEWLAEYPTLSYGGVLKAPSMRGDTPLIAAMRAYVASKFGDEVEL